MQLNNWIKCGEKKIFKYEFLFYFGKAKPSNFVIQSWTCEIFEFEAFNESICLISLENHQKYDEFSTTIGFNLIYSNVQLKISIYNNIICHKFESNIILQYKLYSNLNCYYTYYEFQIEICQIFTMV